ncbi:MAG: YihY/virulence factor BrkB family protein [Microlunatus sp.]|nr:YihY/virulence factor BrkB family protein [Microlunatus sp.]
MAVRERVQARAEHVQTRVERILRIPLIAHIQRAARRFSGRFGYQFGAGVTYFSVLALVPVLMVAFSILGFFLVELRPDLITTVAKLAVSQFRGADEQVLNQIENFILTTLRNYTAIGIAGLITGLYSGAAWMGHLRNAIDAQWRTDFDAQRDTQFYPIKVVVNLARMAGLMVAIAVTFGLATISTNLISDVADWLGYGDTWLTSALLRVLTSVLSLIAGWLTFCYIYVVVPRQRENRRIIMLGALFGAVGLGVLQYGATRLIGAFSDNRAAVIFGPVIVVMLFFNLFAQLILFIAAWIATWDEPAFADPDEGVVRFALHPPLPVDPGPTMVSQETAVRTVRLGLGAGYATGAATGIGLGAVIAWVLAKLSGRRPSR